MNSDHNNDELCTENDESCIENDEFSPEDNLSKAHTTTAPTYSVPTFTDLVSRLGQ